MGIRAGIVKSTFVEGYIRYAICYVFNKLLEVTILLLRALMLIQNANRFYLHTQTHVHTARNATCSLWNIFKECPEEDISN